MTEQIVIAPLIVALVAAIATLGTKYWPRLQRAVSVLGGVAYLAVVALLFQTVQAEGILTYQLSDWAAPFGISVVADSLTAFMLVLGAVVSFVALAFAATYVDEFGQRLSFHPLFHFMMVGVSGSFLTGDIFNLFVWFEVMLMSSYVLVVFYSGAEHTKAALQYVVLNLVGSAIMLLSIGGLYSVTGTLNMADLARRLADPAAYGIDPAPVLGLSVILFAVFALKAGIVPFHWWVPAAYRAAPAPVSAVLAGVVKKVGVYAIIRLYFTIFSVATFGDLGLPGFAGDSLLAFYGPILFVMAAASIFLGGFGAIDRDNLDDLLAYSSIGQVGFIILPLAIGATATGVVPGTGGTTIRTLAITAALIYTVNHGLAKGGLFLVSGAVYEAVGTIEFDDLGGLSERAPTLSVAFLVAALALVGIPPLSGFFGKFLVFDTAVQAVAVDAPGAELALVVALGGAILTIAYVTRAWNRGFWGPPSELVEDAYSPRQQVAIALLLVVAVVAVGIGFDPVFRAAEDAARAATNTGAYRDAVLFLGGGLV
ncbi:MAG TPA: proton-conducting transporter membrane subunit [Natrialbaceae archaeon]|nr:proton-conducting transporter membrane subunit [Natrialbaceae archaeon]